MNFILDTEDNARNKDMFPALENFTGWQEDDLNPTKASEKS